MYLIHCSEMWTSDKIVEGSLTDVCHFLEKCKISKSYVVDIVNLHNDNRVLTYENAKDNPRFERIKILLSPVPNGARVDL